jgi:CRISPR-associated protein Cas8a1/Csx13
MARELVYRLSDPSFTIYHRAALGGLAATVDAWQSGAVDGPPGIEYELETDRVRLAWNDDVADQVALRRILAASFRLTEDKLIDVAGHRIAPGAGALGIRLAIHNGLCTTFLQHNKMRPSEKAPRQVSLRDADGESEAHLTYKAVNAYAHQHAQGTGLLDDPPSRMGTSGRFPVRATIPQSLVPGAMTGARALEATSEEAILLLFLLAGCSVFLLRHRVHAEKMQACVVVPDVSNLRKFARAVQRLAQAEVASMSTGYLERVVGGAEEAALRLLIGLKATALADLPGVIGFQAIAMGKVAWDKNQVNRSSSVRLGVDYAELDVFRAAYAHLGRAKLLKGAKGDSFAITTSAVPELVAANLAADRHWAADFRSLVSEKKDFHNMRFAQRGLQHMQEAIKDDDDRAVIEMFQSAWRQTMGGLGERARRDGLAFDRLIEVERERVRNSVLRSKTPDSLAGWFLRFCADATKGAPLGPAQRQAEKLRKFIFDPRNVERLQNLLLFALVSYAKDTSGRHESTEAISGEG